MKKLFLIVAVLGATFSLFSQNSEIKMDPAIRYGVLDNGLTYYIRHNDVVPERADFYIVQNVGAILEEDSQNGLAHFLEHMAFNGTKNFPDKKIIDYLESVGVQFGNNINAYTSLDETVYNLKSVPTFRPSIVDTALLILHDWSGFISLEEEEIDKERGVIREEWRTRFNSNRRLWKASLPILFANSRYAERDVIGDTTVIANFKYQTLKDFYHKWYRPDLQAIIIVGDVNVDQVEQKVKEYWKDIPKRENPTPRPLFYLMKNEKPIICILKDAEAKNSRIQIDYRHAPMNDEIKASQLGYVYTVTQSLIVKMLSDRLDEIAMKADAPYAGAYTGFGELIKTCDAFTLLAVAKEGNEEQTLKILLQEAERMGRYGFTLSEFERAKADMLSNYEKAYNERTKTKNNSYVNEYVRNFLDFEPIPGIEWEYDFVKMILPQIALADINSYAALFITPKDITVMMTGPEKESVKFPSEQRTLEIIDSVKVMELKPYTENVLSDNLLKKTPKAGSVKSTKSVADFEGVTEWTLSNGMKIVLKPTQLKEDEILIYGYSKGGISLVSDSNKYASANLSVPVAVNNGYGDYNLMDLNKVLAGKYVRLVPSIGVYEESFSGNSSVKDFETLAQLIYLLFKGTRSDDESFQSLMNQYHTSLLNASKDPAKVFQDSVQILANNKHPRTMPFSLDRLAMVSQKTSLEVFDDRFEDPKDFTLFIVGNIDEKTIKPIVETYLGGIPVQKRRALEEWKDLQIRRPKGEVNSIFSQKMEVPKSSNFILISGDMKYNLRNKLMLQLVADILDIRYFESLREMEGGTYGVSVSGSLSRLPLEYASLQMRFDTDPEFQAKLMPLIFEGIDNFIKNGPSDSDFKKVKENLRNKFIESKKENNWHLNSLVSYYKDGWNLEKNYLSTLDTISQEDLRLLLASLYEQGNVLKVVMNGEK